MGGKDDMGRMTRSQPRGLSHLLGPIAEEGTPLKLSLFKKIVGAILDHRLPPAMPLPSTRRLAAELNLSRNTVVHAYSHLAAEGFIRARDRSRFIVGAAAAIPTRLRAAEQRDPEAAPLNWADRMIGTVAGTPRIAKSPGWRSCRFPFVYGQYDAETFPQAQWRDVDRIALSSRAIQGWAGDPGDEDDRQLIEQIRLRLLPARGIWADPSEVLITGGTANALAMIGMLLLAPGFQCAFEEPGHPDMRAVLRLQTSNIQSVEVDAEGLRVADLSPGVSLIYCTPGLQYPTMATMSRSRRRRLYRYARENGTIVVEDDVDAETMRGEPVPLALKSDDPDGRIIYLGSFSKGLGPGLGIGFLVARREVVHELRLLRRLILRSPPTNNQRLIAEFVARGYYDSLAHRLRTTFRERHDILHDVLGAALPGWPLARPQGGSAIWLPLPPHVSSAGLVAALHAAGVFVEGGDGYFNYRPRRSGLRIGYTAIGTRAIREGAALLGRIVQRETNGPR